MSDSPRHPRPSHRVRVRLVVASAATAAAALTVGLALVPAFANAHPGGPRTTADTAALAGRHRRPAPGPTTAPTTTAAAAPTTTAPPTTAPPAAGDPNPNCTLIVPPAPLSAAGLATPYRLVATDPAAGACHEANADQSAFVEASILDPATGKLSVYHPLVVDDGTQPAVPPVAVTLPRRAVVGLWFGYQADVLKLRQRHLRRGFMGLRFHAGDSCVNGSPGSPFGQFAYCNAPQFFAAANAAIKAGKLAVPPLGTGNDGKPCPTTRDFSVVDQDQSDNLPGSYLATADGRIAQFSADNQKALPGATVLNNASDNGLVDHLLDPVLGCTPLTAPDLSAGQAPSPSMALNELQAAADQAAPVALVPLNDPMTVGNNGNTNVLKTDLYRAGVDMVRINPAVETGKAYCLSMAQAAVPRLALDEHLTAAAPSPDTGVAADLHGFLVARLDASWTNLGCPALTSISTPEQAAGSTATATATATAAPIAAATAATDTTDTTAPADPTDTTAPTNTTAPATDPTAPATDPNVALTTG